MSLNIGLHTNEIVNDYLAATGRNEYKTLISPQEYLLFRQQAIEEAKQGICRGANTAHVQNRQDEQDSTKNLSEATLAKKTENKPNNSPKEDCEIPVVAKTPNDKKIIPITQKTKTTTHEAQMLAIMQAIDG